MWKMIGKHFYEISAIATAGINLLTFVILHELLISLKHVIMAAETLSPKAKCFRFGMFDDGL